MVSWNRIFELLKLVVLTFLAIGALADAIGNGFGRYVDHLMLVLSQALSNLQHWQLFGVAVGVAGALYRAFGKDPTKYADKLVYLLRDGVTHTSEELVSRSVCEADYPYLLWGPCYVSEGWL